MEVQNLYNSPKVANVIKSYAKSKNIALKDVLLNCSLGSNTFSHMLHGKSIAFDSLAKIADYLDCSVDYLLGRTDNPEINKMPVFDNLPMQENYKIAAFGGDNEEVQPPIEEITT